jgi:hypothetical protein
MLQEDAETLLGKIEVTSSISRHSSTFPDVFISLKPPFKREPENKLLKLKTKCLLENYAGHVSLMIFK